MPPDIDVPTVSEFLLVLIALAGIIFNTAFFVQHRYRDDVWSSLRFGAEILCYLVCVVTVHVAIVLAFYMCSFR